jgi:hypothetical protein
MLSRDQSPQFVEMSRVEAELLLKALNYYQVRLFDEISRKEKQSLDEEVTQITALIKRIHKFHEGPAK